MTVKDYSSKKIILAAGGTGGHIIPALSIAEELKAHRVHLLYVGNQNSMESKIISQSNLEFEEINVQKLYRKFTLTHIKFPFKLISSILRSLKIIKSFKPDAFLGTGGFVCGPVGYAAYLKKIPVYIQEQNSYPGLTTRILAKYANKVFLGNENAKEHLPKNKLVFSGNPINQNVIKESDHINYSKYGLRKDSLKIFLTGGSQGSVTLNKVLYSILDELLDKQFEIIWQIGDHSFEEFYAKIKDKKGVYGFKFTDEMGKIYNSVDIVISRGGAISLAEIETKKIPSIIIPLASAAGDHQYYNALELEEKKVACLIKQNNLNSNILMNKILYIKNNMEKMKSDFKNSLHSNAAKLIADTIVRRI